MHTEFDSKVSLEMSILKTGDDNNKLDLIKKSRMRERWMKLAREYDRCYASPVLKFRELLLTY